MQYIGSYQIEVKLGNNLLEISPSTYSFMIKDSINQLYPELNFEISDATGIFQESMYFTEGQTIELSYGDKDKFLKNKYVFINDELPELYSNDSIGGKFHVRALHEYYSKQNIESKAYSNRISLIIDQLASQYNFKSKNIEGTGSEDIWYCPLMNQEEFIYNILLPNSFSNDSKDSPFYCFIDSDNNFNFRNYFSMMSSAPVSDLILSLIAQNNIDKNIIQSYKRLRMGSLITKKLRKRNLYSRDRKTGELTTTTDNIFDYPLSTGQLTGTGNPGNLPITIEPNTTDYEYFFYDETKAGPKEAFQARQISTEKDSFVLDRVLVTTLLNVDIKSGLVVNLQVPLKSQENTVLSTIYSGKYIVESCSHIWQGDKQRGYSQFILSRKFMNITNQTGLKPNFMKGS